MFSCLARIKRYRNTGKNTGKNTGNNDVKIAIAGAGIGGLSAAALLAQDGHQIDIYDQFDRPEPVGSGLVIQPVGQAVLQRIGTAQMAETAGRRITRMLGHEADSHRTVLDVRYDGSGPGRYGLALHRTALFEAVYQGALAAGVTLHTSRKITGITDTPRRLIFADGNRSPAYGLVVDAAGAASPLSPLLGKPLAFGALWGTVDWPDKNDLPRDQLSQMYRRADRMLGVLPIGRMPGQNRDRATIFWSLPATDHDLWCNTPLSDWIAEATRLWPKFAPFLSQITDHNQMEMARYSHGTLKKPWADGLVHIGDAAHRASPQLGQGANMALLDAHALAAALRQHNGYGENGHEALAHYARLRRWHVRLYQGMSWAFTPQYQSSSRFLPILRDRLFAPASRITPAPWLLSRLVCGDLIQPYAGLPPGQ